MNRPRTNDYQSESSTSTESSPTYQGPIRPDYENQIEIAVQRKEINLEEEEDGRCYETISEVNRKIDETGCWAVDTPCDILLILLNCFYSFLVNRLG